MAFAFPFCRRLLVALAICALAGCARPATATPPTPATPAPPSITPTTSSTPAPTTAAPSPRASSSLTATYTKAPASTANPPCAKTICTTGDVLREVPLASEYFGEGLTILGNKAYQLTWQNHLGFVYDLATFHLINTFTYTGEGWGLTTDGHSLIMSDGTSQIRFLDPATFAVQRTITVTTPRPARHPNQRTRIHQRRNLRQRLADRLRPPHRPRNRRRPRRHRFLRPPRPRRPRPRHRRPQRHRLRPRRRPPLRHRQTLAQTLRSPPAPT